MRNSEKGDKETLDNLLSGELMKIPIPVNSVLRNENAALEVETILSEIGILGANKSKMFNYDSDSDLYHANSQLLSFSNPSTYIPHRVTLHHSRSSS